MLNFLKIIIDESFVIQFLVALIIVTVKLEKEKLFPLRISGGIILELLINYRWVDYNQSGLFWLFILQYVLSFVLFYTTIKFSFKIGWIEALYFTSCAYVLQHLGYQLTDLLIFILQQSNVMMKPKDISTPQEGILYFVYKIIIDIGCFALIYIPSAIVVIPHLKNTKIIIKNKKWIAIQLAAIFTTIALNMVRRYVDDNSFVFNIYSIIFCSVILFSLVYVWKNNKIELENKYMEEILKMNSENEQKSLQATEMLRMKYHDFKHQLNYIQSISKDNKEIQDYISGVQQSFDQANAYIKTGIKPIDVILTNKSLICQKENINFTHCIEIENLNCMKSEDIYGLLGNMLDNAIEASLNVSDISNRVISLIIKLENEMIHFSIDNYYENDLLDISDNKLPQTIKKDKQVHGIGLKSIKYITEKYNGGITISSDENIFSLDIVIPNSI